MPRRHRSNRRLSSMEMDALVGRLQRGETIPLSDVVNAASTNLTLVIEKMEAHGDDITEPDFDYLVAAIADVRDGLDLMAERL